MDDQPRVAGRDGAPEKIRVLVADDHGLLRSGVVYTINQEADMEVVGEACHGADAVELYAACRPDVALLDLEMPVMDGYHAISQIRSRFPDARIVILTIYQTVDDIERGLRAGAMAYLLKDARPAELTGCIREVVAGRKCVAPAVAARLADRVTGVQLTGRELEVLRLITRGLSNKEIATETGVAEGTVKAHLTSVFEKLGVTSRTEAIAASIRRGLVRVG